MSRVAFVFVLLVITLGAMSSAQSVTLVLLWAGLIHLAFPRAIIIHCHRAAVDTALSIHQIHFHSSFAFPTGGTELVEYFRVMSGLPTTGELCCRRIASSMSITRSSLARLSHSYGG